MKRKSEYSKKGALLLAFFLVFLAVGCGSDNYPFNESTSTVDTDVEGTNVTHMADNPAEMAVGDVMMFDFGSSNGNVEVDFSGVSESAEFYLGLASVSQKAGSRNVTVMSENAIQSLSEAKAMAAPAAMAKPMSPDAAFAKQLREMEVQLSNSDELDMADNHSLSSVSKAMLASASTASNTVERFRVLESISSATDYVNVSGILYYEGDNVRCFVDQEVEQTNPDDLTYDDVAWLCGNFDDQIDQVTPVLGDMSDVNDDGKIDVLMTPVVNRLVMDGVVTGFFYARDLHARSESNDISNEREIIYTLVPDPSGRYGGTAIDKDFAINNYLSAVMIHEYQHAVSFNQHVFINKSEAEVGWLNEGLSHFIEGYVGFGQENPSRYQMFLDMPNYYSAMDGEQPNLGSRGASYLLLNYLYQQHQDGEAFLSNLLDTNLRGAENLVAAFDQGAEGISNLGDMFSHWMAALLMTDTGLTSDSRYIYQDRHYNSDTERWMGVLMHGQALDGRGTMLSGPALSTFGGAVNATLSSGSVSFYDMGNVQDSMQFFGGSDGDFSAVLVRKQ